MRILTTLLVLAPLFAQSADEKEAVAAVQKVFDAMAGHDADKIRQS